MGCEGNFPFPVPMRPVNKVGRFDVFSDLSRGSITSLVNAKYMRLAQKCQRYHSSPYTYSIQT